MNTLRAVIAADTLQGGIGPDFLGGAEGDDALLGGDGDDFLEGGADDDTLTGGAGNDIYSFSRAETSDLGSDLVVDETGLDNDSIDILLFEEFGEGVSVDLGDTDPQLIGTGPYLTLTLDNSENIEGMIGSMYADALTGNSRSNVISGLAGDDTITDDAGRDILIGADGLDDITGGEGDDILIGGDLLLPDEDGLAAIVAIHDEWNSGRTYAERVANLDGTGTGTRWNEDYFLIADETVFDDDDTGTPAVDSLLGEGDLDWFFYHISEDTTDADVGEEETPV